MLNKNGLQFKKTFFLRSAQVFHVSCRGKLKKSEKKQDKQKTDAWSLDLKFSHRSLNVVICNKLSYIT